MKINVMEMEKFHPIRRKRAKIVSIRKMNEGKRRHRPREVIQLEA